MNNIGKSNKSLYEKSMEMVVNIVKLSSSESSAFAALELSTPTMNNQTPSSSLVGVMDLIVPAITTSNQAMPEAPNPVPVIQVTNGPATTPMLDFF
ncbi:hypothetical protein LOK49_LG05G01471 [Camellia lanceoleosa]|uniref:Uncharacterized protein n=1 Tax=Camellia lanceoleosa TaxID=1840588 RepID=A0ACC0HTP9_9ERIC|nr:hypothetical protein LOK49_Contig745G00003 [Camellia lanceoleosa]KAI8015867.1 hypothetical protein LOK49_LG05G01471 [Camellia lanceoleosa]